MRLAIYHNLPDGGALRSVKEVLRHLPPDVTVDVYAPDWRPAHLPFMPEDPAPTVPGVSIIRIPLTRWLFSGIGRATALLGRILAIRIAEARVVRRINRGGYDAVLVHPCWVTQTPGLMSRLRPPTAYYMHEPRRATFEENYRQHDRPQGLRRLPRWAVGEVIEAWLAHADRRAARAPDLILTNSRFSEAAVLRAYGRAATVSYLGVDESVFVPSGKARANYVVVVGGLEAFKRPDLAVTALAALPAGTRPTLHLVYERMDATYADHVRRLAADGGVVLVEHHHIPDEELARIYAHARLTLLPARLEPFGLTSLESISSGTPVLAVREGGYPETVTPAVNGYLVDDATGLPSALASALADTLNGDPDAVRASILPFWTWRSATERQVALIRELVEGP